MRSEYGWSSKGKSWSGMGPLKNHLAQYVGSANYDGYNKEKLAANLARILDEWEVVEFIMKDDGVIPMGDLYNDFTLIKKASR